MPYVVHYGDMQTGFLYGTLPVAACSVSDELRQASTFQARIPIGHATEAWAALNHGPADMWVLEWAADGGRRAVAAGPLLPQTFDADGITLAGAGLWWVFQHRMAVHRDWTPSTTSAPAGPIWSMSGWDLGTIQRFLCWETSELSSFAAPYAYLPIEWEDERGGSHQRTYEPYDLVTVAQRVEEIGNVEVGTDGKGGPDWALLPTLYPDTSQVWFRFLTGTQAQPMLFGDEPPLVLDAAAPGQNRLRNLTGQRDGGRKATRVFASGGGTEYSKVVKVAEVAERSTGVRVDAVVTSDALEHATVQGYADAGLTKRRRTPSGLTVEVDAAWWWRHDGRVGLPVRLLWRDHPIVGDLDVTSRVTQWSADVASRWVQLTLADTTVEI